MFFKKSEQKLLEELRNLSERLAEDRIYEEVLTEIELNNFDAVAKARALEEAEGHEQKARALYIKHRVRRINDLSAEYSIWLEQQRASEEEAKKRRDLEDEAKRVERQKIIDSVEHSGKPPAEICARYNKEFADFYASWLEKDYARKFVPISSAWKEFLTIKKVI